VSILRSLPGEGEQAEIQFDLSCVREIAGIWSWQNRTNRCECTIRKRHYFSVRAWL